MNDTTIPPTLAPDDHWVALPQGRLFVRRWSPPPRPGAGAMAPIVLFHESLGCVDLWRGFPATLCAATGRTVVAYDRLGFGQSDPRPGMPPMDFVEEEARTSLPALRAQLGIGRYVALGHSVGGGMAAHVAAAYPQQCVALVTESAQTFVEDRTLDGIRVARDQFAQPGQLERLSKYHGDKAAWVLSAWVDTWLSPAFAAYTMQAALAQVRCPVLAIHGEQDEYGSLVHPRNIAAWVPGAVEQEIVAGGGHVPHREQPERIVARIAQFVQPLA